MHKHHIVFKGQGGLDFPLDLIELTQEQHEGPEGPHLNRKVDIALKTGLQEKLYGLFKDGHYTAGEISVLLGKRKDYIEKHFRKVSSSAGIYAKEDIIRRLMGGRLY